MVLLNDKNDYVNIVLSDCRQNGFKIFLYLGHFIGISKIFCNCLSKEEEGFTVFVLICDINTKDEYKELILKVYLGDADISSACILQYRNKKLKTLADLINLTKDNIGLDVAQVTTDGKDIAYLRVVKKNGKKSWIYVSPGVGEIFLLEL